MQELAGSSRTQATSTGAFIQWGPVIGGAIIGAALISVLMTFAAALGLLMASPAPSWRETSVWLVLLSGIWMLLVYLLGFGLAGYVAGRLRLPGDVGDPQEVEFRDGVNGLCAWALAVIVGALLLWAAVTGLAATRSDAAAANEASEPSYLVSELDRLFRADGRPRDDDMQARRAEAARIVSSGLGRGDLVADDRAYLVRLVAARTGLAPAEAERRVTQVMQMAKTAASKARRTAVIIGFMTAASLLLGAAAAWLAALAGGRHRDGETVPSLSAMTWNSLAASRR